MLNATVLASIVTQVVAFLLFLWILKKYAWGPVLHLLESRREQIAAQYDAVDRLKQETQRLQEEYAARLHDIDQEARSRIADAVAEAQRIREEILAKAHQEGKALLDKQKQLIELEIAKARISIKDEVVEMVLRVSEQLLREKLDDAKHRALVERFVADVQAVSGRN